MSRRFLRKTSVPTAIQKLTVKAIMERKLVNEGDRILIAVSGGKDSTILAWALSSIRPALKINYELAALHISHDFNTGCNKIALSKRLAGWGIPLSELYVPVIERLKEGKKMNCYWCSTQRRTELIKYAMENGFNKIALGHHLDDIIETVFMNMFYKAEIMAMPILLKYRKFPITLIRPLAYIEEKQIIACAEGQDILKETCTCPYGSNSKRRVIRQRIADFTSGTGMRPGDVKRQIIKALSSPHDYLTE